MSNTEKASKDLEFKALRYASADREQELAEGSHEKETADELMNERKQELWEAAVKFAGQHVMGHVLNLRTDMARAAREIADGQTETKDVLEQPFRSVEDLEKALDLSSPEHPAPVAKSKPAKPTRPRDHADLCAAAQRYAITMDFILRCPDKTTEDHLQTLDELAVTELVEAAENYSAEPKPLEMLPPAPLAVRNAMANIESSLGVLTVRTGGNLLLEHELNHLRASTAVLRKHINTQPSGEPDELDAVAHVPNDDHPPIVRRLMQLFAGSPQSNVRATMARRELYELAKNLAVRNTTKARFELLEGAASLTGAVIDADLDTVHQSLLSARDLVSNAQPQMQTTLDAAIANLESALKVLGLIDEDT